MKEKKNGNPLNALPDWGERRDDGGTRRANCKKSRETGEKEMTAAHFQNKGTA